MKLTHHPILKGTLILTMSGVFIRLIGFLYRIFLSRTFGAEQLGLYQMIFPIYALSYSLTSSGFETALTQIIARKEAEKKPGEGWASFLLALVCSLFFSLIVCLVVHRHADWLAITILGDARCALLLRYLVIAFPFTNLHGCMMGYFIGKQKAAYSATSQIVEQMFRVGSSFILFMILSFYQLPNGIQIAVIGLAFGECCACAVSLPLLLRERPFRCYKRNGLSIASIVSSLFSVAVPLTGNRVLLNLIQSAEAILIPRQLMVYGVSHSDALSTYGILSGMAYPCILFPSAITNSLSAVLMPNIATLETSRNHNQLVATIRRAILVSILIGFGSLLTFFSLGRFAGQFLFHEPLAGSFIRILCWICPFLFTNAVMFSIINGFGKTNITFLISLTGLTIRILSVLLVIPLKGIYGYLLGLLVSQITTSFCAITWLKHHLKTN